MLPKVTLLMVGLLMGGATLPQSPAQSQRTDQTPPVDKQAQAPLQQKQPTAAELSAKDTPGSAMLRTFEFEEYQFWLRGRGHACGEI
jgi:hypothetical protein